MGALWLGAPHLHWETRGWHRFPGYDGAGEHVGSEQRTHVGPTKAAVGRDAGARQRQEVDFAAVLDNSNTMLKDGCDVVAPVSVDAEPIPPARAEDLNDPFSGTVRINSLKTIPLHNDDVVIRI